MVCSNCKSVPQKLVFEIFGEVHHGQQLLAGYAIVDFCFRQIPTGVGHDSLLSVHALRQNTADGEIGRVSIEDERPTVGWHPTGEDG